LKQVNTGSYQHADEGKDDQEYKITLAILGLHIYLQRIY